MAIQKNETCQFTFKPAVEKIIGYDSAPLSIAVGYFNNDTSLDIAVAKYGASNIGIFLGYGNGTFAQQSTYSTGSGSLPCSIAICDFNNDKISDIIVANYGTNNIVILLGTGNGTLLMINTYSTGSSRPLSVAVGDFNQDGWIDIVVASDATNSISVFLGLGYGSFDNQTTYSTGYDSLPYFVAVGDFDNDSVADIVVGNFGTNNVGIFLGFGDGTFAIPQMYSTGIGSHPFSIAVGDFNSDHKQDIIVANAGTDNVGVLFGYGNGTFAIGTNFSIGFRSGPKCVIVADFDKNNKLDIIVANSENNTISLLFGDGKGGVVTQTTYSTGFGSSPFSIVAADFDKDNRSDIAISNFGSNKILVFLGYAIQPFADGQIILTNAESHPFSIASGDFNNDKWLDVVVANSGLDTISVLRGDGNGSFQLETTLSTGRGSSPSSIAVADFNGDNQLDIAVVNYNTDNVGVLLGYGNGTFANLMMFSTGTSSNPCSLAVGDFNNDTSIDIVVANYGPDSIGVLLGYGNGSFAKQKEYLTGNQSGPSSVAVGDFNNDNRLDIVVADRFTDNVAVLLGFGNGTFATPNLFPCDPYSQPRSVIIGHFNKDNYPDICVANSNADNIGVFLGYGNGTFSNSMTYSTGVNSNPAGMALGDFNEDKLLDIVVSNMGTNNIYVFYGYGNGTFAEKYYYQTGIDSNPYSVAVDDFNKDTLPDMVVTNVNADNVIIYMGYQQRNFSIQRVYSTGSAFHPCSVVISDFNNDTRLDIVVVNSGNEDVGVLLGYGNGYFQNQTTYRTGSSSSPQYAAVDDFDKDHRMDIAVTNLGTGNVGIFLGYDNGTFSRETTYSTGFGSSPSSIAVGDFNNDTRLDILVTNNGTDNLILLLGFDYRAFKIQGAYDTGFSSYPRWIAVGDFNNDNQLDLVIANSNSNSVAILLNYGNGSFASETMYSTDSGSRPCSVAVGDFNNDKKLDIVVANFDDNNISVLLGYGNGTLAAKITYSTGNESNPNSVAVGDFNNDKKLDIVVANNLASNVGVLFGYGNGTFAEQETYSTGFGSGPFVVAVGDFNNDKNLDIVVANSAADNVCVLLGYRNGTFSPLMTYPTGLNSVPYSVAVGDFNNDKNLDIVVGNYLAGNVGVLLGYGNGTFAEQKTYLIGLESAPFAVAVGDFNGDTYLDIVVANRNTNGVALFFGYGDGTFTSVMIQSTGSNPYLISVVVADFNNDTLLDLAVANFNANNVVVLLGYGTKLFGSAIVFSAGNGSLPYSIAVGDFNNDTRLDITVANYGANNIGILLGYGNGSFAAPTTYSTGNGSRPYSVTVHDLNNDTLLDILVANSGSDNIGILLGYGNGTFAAQRTYPTGLRSEPIQTAVGDFNNDNFLDIVVADFGSNNIIVFLGYGNGTFEELESLSWGFETRPCSVAVGDFTNDSRNDIAVANYGANNVEILLKSC